MADRPWRNHHICFGQPGPGLPNLQVSVSSSRPTLQQTSTSAEVSEPPAHLQVEIGPCWTASSNFGNVPGGFGTTGLAMLWLDFSLWAGATPSLFLLWWPFQTRGCSASGRMIRVGLLQGLRWGRVDSNKRISQ